MKIKFFKKFRSFIKGFANEEPSLDELVKKEKKTNKELTRILTQRHEPLWIPSLRSFSIIALFVLLFALLSHPQLIVEYFVNPIFCLFERIFGGFTSY